MRTTDNRHGSSRVLRTKAWNGAISTVVQVDPSAKIGMYKEADDLPKGKQKYAPGHFRLNPFHVSSTTAEGSSSQVLLPKTTTYGSEYLVTGQIASHLVPRAADGTHLWGYQPFYPDTSKLAELSLVKAVSKISDAQLDVGMMLAELPEVLHMLRNPLQGIVKLAKKWNSAYSNRYKRNPLRQVDNYRAMVDALSSTWLEYRYGIVPLINDVENIREHYTKVVKKQSLIRHRSKIEKTIKYEFSGSQQDLGYKFYKHSFDESLKVCTHVYYRKTIAEGWDYPTLTAYGLSLSQLPSLLYELIPYSFVLDWFTNTGSWIKALQPLPPHVERLGACQTFTRKTTEVRRIVAWTDQYQRPLAGCLGSVHRQATASFQRTIVLNTMPATPVINVDLSALKRQADGLSLLWQQLPSFRRPHAH